MRQRDRESSVDSDPHGLLFDPFHEPGPGPRPHPGPPRKPTRSEARAQVAARKRRRRGRRVVLLCGLFMVAVLAGAVWYVAVPVFHHFRPTDYSGAGTGTRVVTVNSGDGATQIGDTLYHDGVVASVGSFVDAAARNAKSQNIQPGSYRLRSHMSSGSALNLLLDPASRVRSDLILPQGATSLDVEQRLTTAPCAASAPSDAVCGPGLPAAAVKKALADPAALGLPTDYTSNGRKPTSAEGFLYPATYTFGHKTAPAEALQQMVLRFVDATRTSDFGSAAEAEHLTPYQALTIASIAQSEAKFPSDYAKVARVILNRLAEHKPLQVDATSAYAAKLKGLDPSKVLYSAVDGPYNTYQNAGLPPTPISNPGDAALNGAVHPAAGNWLFYVNGDAAGHLFFTNSEKAFEKAAAECRTNGWGCG